MCLCLSGRKRLKLGARPSSNVSRDELGWHGSGEGKQRVQNPGCGKVLRAGRSLIGSCLCAQGLLVRSLLGLGAGPRLIRAVWAWGEFAGAEGDRGQNSERVRVAGFLNQN